MKELWEQATQIYNLPLTIGLIFFCLYWIISSLGVFDFDSDVDVDLDVEADADVSASGGVFNSILNFVNAADVPVMLVLTVLNVFAWVISMISNGFWNPNHSIGIAALLFVLNFVISVVLTRYMTKPLMPIFKAIRNDVEAAAPLIGQSGKVKSKVLDHKYGQVEVKRDKQAPALLNCKLSENDQPLVRGNEVLVVSYEQSSKRYIVRSMRAMEDKSIFDQMLGENDQEKSMDNLTIKE